MRPESPMSKQQQIFRLHPFSEKQSERVLPFAILYTASVAQHSRIIFRRETSRLKTYNFTNYLSVFYSEVTEWYRNILEKKLRSSSCGVSSNSLPNRTRAILYLIPSLFSAIYFLKEKKTNYIYIIYYIEIQQFSSFFIKR